jgi:branched-chain amino acid transport system ATP-binding protein
VLEIRGITKQFGGLTALQDVAFTVGRGELVALVGPNGAGKSTLFNIIAGAFPPTRGHVIFDGRDVTGRSSHALAQLGVARTFQQTTLFGEQTALENVLQGLHRHTPARLVAGLLATPSYRREQRALERRARAVLEFLGIAAYADAIAADLPLGIQKLLTVAVALATDPVLLLLDEPAAGLSHDEATRMMNLVASEIRTRCTVVLVEHNMRIVAGWCDRAVVLQFGQKIYDGTPEGLTRDQRVVDAYLGVAELT